MLVAVKADSDITDLAQIADQKLAVKFLGGDTPHSQPVLAYYGLDADKVKSYGGSVSNALVAGVTGVTDFDVIVSELASPRTIPSPRTGPRSVKSSICAFSICRRRC